MTRYSNSRIEQNFELTYPVRTCTYKMVTKLVFKEKKKIVKKISELKPVVKGECLLCMLIDSSQFIIIVQCPSL